MKNWVFYSSIIILSSFRLNVFATESRSLNLSDFAKEELETLVLEKKPSLRSDQRNSLATINARAPKPDPKNQTTWGLGIQYQNLTLSGQKQLQFIQQSNLSSSTGAINQLSFSLSRKIRFRASSLSQWGVGVVVGGGRSDVDGQATSGRQLIDAQMQTQFLALEISGNIFPLDTFAIELSLLAGQRNFTQVSSNTSARYSETSGFLAPGLKFNYFLTPKISMGLKYENHFYPNQPDIVSDAHNYQLLMEYLYL